MIGEISVENNFMNCRYISFINVFYFCSSTYTSKNIDKKFKTLHDINNYILELSLDVKDSKVNKIIEYFHKNKLDSKNYLIDIIKKENDPNNRKLLTL